MLSYKINQKIIEFRGAALSFPETTLIQKNWLRDASSNSK
jgi:hypothetical protein